METIPVLFVCVLLILAAIKDDRESRGGNVDRRPISWRPLFIMVGIFMLGYIIIIVYFYMNRK